MLTLGRAGALRGTRKGSPGFDASQRWQYLALGVLLIGCGAHEAPTAVDVAVAAPFADTGLMAEARQAYQLVVEQINEGGGINGKPLKVHERDTPIWDPADLLPVAEGFVDLTAEGYKYIISLISGSAVVPMMDAAMPRGVLAMSITSEDSVLDLPAYDGMLLRGILPTERLIQMQASAMQAEGFSAIAIVGETVAGVPDARQSAMQAAYARCAECTVTHVTYPAEADLYRYDWQSVGEEVRAGAPDVVFLTSTNLPALLDTIYWIEDFGYTGLYYFAYGAYMGSLVPALPGSHAPERFRSYDLALPPSLRLDQFLAAYQERYDDSFLPEPRLMAFVDYLALLSLAMTQVGDGDPYRVSAAMKEIAGPPGEEYGPMDYVEAVTALRQGRDINFVGLSGPLDFDARGEVSDGFIQQYGVSPAGQVAEVH